MNIAKIAAMATAIPKEQVNLLDLGFDVETMKRTMKVTGIESVRYAPSNKTSTDYCLSAARELLSSLNLSPSSIDGVIFSTPRSDYVHPGNCSIIHKELGIPKSCIAMDIRHVCTGMVYGLYIADRMVECGDCRNVLVLCGDTASHRANIRDKALRMVNGDGGAAAIVTASGKVRQNYSFCHDGSKFKNLYMPAGGERIPIKFGVTDQEEIDSDGNVRSLENDFMDGMEVMRFVLNEVPIIVDDVLNKSNWQKDEIDICAFHQANEIIIKSLYRSLHLNKNKVPFEVGDTGNIAGASLILALCRASEKPHEPWRKALLCAFGSGMSVAAMTTDLSETIILPVKEI